MCGYCQIYKPRVDAGEIKATSLTLGPVAGGYSIYNYKAYHLTFDSGEGFTTSQFMHPSSAEIRKHLESAFSISAT